MRSQTSQVQESLVAYSTVVGPLAGVAVHMCCQTFQVQESLVTYSTVVGPLARVPAHMSLQRP